MTDHWVDLTPNFDPREDLTDLFKPLQQCRVMAVDGDGLYVFLDPMRQIRHAVYWLADEWICPCRDAQPCAAVVVMQVKSFAWDKMPTHQSGDA